MALRYPPGLFLILNPYDAAVQLIYKLPGKYRLVRRIHFPNVVEGTNLAFRKLRCPSYGTSEVTLRASTDPQYEMGLLQTTTLTLRTQDDDQSASRVEKRAFRILNGRWSLWDLRTDQWGVEVVGPQKLADLVLDEVPLPTQVGGTPGDVVQKAALKGGPWQDHYGKNWAGMCVWVGERLSWQIMLHLERQWGGVREVCSDEFLPLDGEGEA